MKISKNRLVEIIKEECDMASLPSPEQIVADIDDEGGFAKRQLYDMEQYARELGEMLSDTTELEAWVQAKLTKAADYLKTVKEYVQYGTEEGAYGAVGGDMDPIDPVGYDVDDAMVVQMLEKLVK